MESSLLYTSIYGLLPFIEASEGERGGKPAAAAIRRTSEQGDEKQSEWDLRGKMQTGTLVVFFSPVARANLFVPFSHLPENRSS